MGAWLLSHLGRNCKVLDMMNNCCAECSEENGGVSLKMCKACKLVKYCLLSYE